MGMACIMHEKNRNVYRILVEKQAGKKLLERSRLRWKDNGTRN
jgi:hypothetical protein